MTPTKSGGSSKHLSLLPFTFTFGISAFHSSFTKLRNPPTESFPGHNQITSTVCTSCKIIRSTPNLTKFILLSICSPSALLDKVCLSLPSHYPRDSKLNTPHSPPRSRPPRTQQPTLPVPAAIITMAIPGYCNHSFNMLKSESTLIQWVCSMCHSGPHWYIYECKYCKLKTCRPCTNKV